MLSLFMAFVAVAVIQLLYVIVLFVRTPRMPCSVPMPTANLQPVSVVICARNEAANLSANLPLVLAQRYDNAAGAPLFEVIVVDDASNDDTASVLKALAVAHLHLKIVTVSPSTQRQFPGKKYALSVGASQAANDLLVFTDADCAPASAVWLKSIAAPLVMGKEIVLGYGGYRKAGGLLNAFIRWETVHTFLQYSSYALAGNPYMAVGRNMACARNALDKAMQHPAWSALPSGDDDVIVAASATAGNTTVVAAPAAYTFSSAPASKSAWVRQKQRHLSTGKYYRTVPKLLLGLYATSHALIWLLFFALLATQWSYFAIPVFAVRCLALWLVMGATASKLGEGGLFFFFPFFDIAWMIYNFAFLPYIMWKDKQQWT